MFMWNTFQLIVYNTATSAADTRGYSQDMELYGLLND